MSILNLPYELYLIISSYLLKSDMYGFMAASKKTKSLLIWNYDHAGVHICMGCDLTGSMGHVYQNLKIHLLQTLKDLKQSDKIGRVLSSACFYWDSDRCTYSNEPYVQIQPPAESIFKQEKLISNAHIDSGGGPECGGIALCELETLFRNRWISQHVGNFSQSLDVLLLCLDAPFHFIEDTESYHEVTRKHSISTDWIAAIHKMCEKGVLIIMVLINTQSHFRKSLRLIGGFNQALGGISIEVEPNSLTQLPLFIKSIIEEETHKRKIVHEVYKKIAYRYRYLSADKLANAMSEELKLVDDEITCANIPESSLVRVETVPNAKELAQCKTMSDAVNAGLLESEAVTKRLYFNKNNMTMPVACSNSHNMPGNHHHTQLVQPAIGQNNPLSDDYEFDDELPELPLMLPMLCRQQSECITSCYSQPQPKKVKTLSSVNNLILPVVPMFRMQSSIPNIKPIHVTRELTLCKLLDDRFVTSVNTFGLVRNKSIAQSVPNLHRRPSICITPALTPIIEDMEGEVDEKKNELPMEDRFCIIEGSIKCYLKNPIIDLGSISSTLLNLVNRSGDKAEESFKKLLKNQSPKQYDLYMSGGLFSRFTADRTQTDVYRPNINRQVSNGLINNMPTLQRSFSDSYNQTSTTRIAQFIRSNSINE